MVEPTHTAASPAVLQRSRGACRLAFEHRDGRGGPCCVGPDRTILAENVQSGTAKVRAMRLDNGGFKEAVLINTSGGLTDGDRFDVEARWDTGAQAIVTTQAAERIYRARHGQDAASLATRLNVAPGAQAVWAPQETIVFDGGRFSRTTHIDVASDGELIACEALVFGRTAMGEAVNTGSVHDAWRVRVDGRLVYADRLALDGDVASTIASTVAGTLARPALGGGAVAAATILYVGQHCDRLCQRVRAAMADVPVVWGASTRLGVLVVRVLADHSIALRAGVEAALACLLGAFGDHNANDLPGSAGPCLPRSWAL